MELRETAAEYTAPRRPVPTGKISFEEFLEWTDEDTWAAWVDGEVILLTPASWPHQDIVLFLGGIMREFAYHRQCGTVLIAPFLIHLPEQLRRGREPDIIFIGREQLPRLHRTYFVGAPDVMVEITSPESCVRDRQVKYNEYQAAGVKEYWLIDPDRRRAEFYRLGADGRYRLIPADSKGVFRSEAFPGFWLKTGWLWQEPLPSVVSYLKELGVM